jgi:hypothetical protein
LAGIAADSWSTHEMGKGDVGCKLETIRRFDVVTDLSLFRFVEVTREVLVSPSACIVSARAAVAGECATELNSRDVDVSTGGVGKPTFIVSHCWALAAAIIWLCLMFVSSFIVVVAGGFLGLV